MSEGLKSRLFARWRFTGVLALMAIAVLVFATACGGDDGDTSSADADSGDRDLNVVDRRTAEDSSTDGMMDGKTGVVRIGSVQPTSGGGLAFYGQSEEDGLSLAVQQINEAGGFVVGDTTYTIEVVYRDNRSDMATAVAAVTELVRDEGIGIIFGPLPHGPGMAAAEITQPNEVLHLMALSILTSADGPLNPETAKGSHKWLFQIEPAELVRSTITAAGVLDILGAQPGDKSLILATDDPSGQFLGRFYNGVLKALGQETEPVVFYPPGTTDFTPFLTKIKAQEPDFMHNWYIANDSALIAEQAFELEVAKSGYMIFGIDPGWWEENVGYDTPFPVALACINLCRAINTSEKAAAHYRAVNEFQCGNEDGCTPAPLTDITLWQYDYVFMLVEAMKKAGTVTDNTAIATAMEGISIDAVLDPNLTMDADWHRSAHGYDTCKVHLGTVECNNYSLAEYGPEALGVTDEFVLANQDG